MKILVDTNIILDVILKRDPFYAMSMNVLRLAQREDIQEYVSASAITDIYYLSYRQLRDKKLVKGLIKNLLTVVSVAYVSEREIVKAIELDWSDFEDTVQYSVALLQQMEGIVTRNTDDYKKSEIPIWRPQELLKEFNID